MEAEAVLEDIRPPQRTGKQRYDEAGWASDWKASNQWLVRLSQLAQHDTARRKAIEETCTYVEVARDFKTMLSISEFAWDERPKSLIILP